MTKHIALIIGLAFIAGVTHGAIIADRIGFDAVGIARTDDLSKFEGGVGLRLSYDLSQRFGIVLEADGSDTHGTAIESTMAAVKFSLPLGKFPVKPYLIGGAGFKFPSTAEYLVGGGGLEYRWRALRVFTEACAEKSVETPVSGKFVGGVGFRF